VISNDEQLSASEMQWQPPNGDRLQAASSCHSALSPLELYLAGSVMLFETSSGCNYQVQFIRDRRALPITRDYMTEAEARYRDA
jgi:hypothetical protein